ncbi:HTH domain-containing protein, partial [Hungatella sp.]
MKTEILKAIKEEAGFVSGQELCDRFGVSRTAVWKAIGQLKEEGFQIEAVRNKGYRLLSSDDVITEAELMSSMEGGFIKKIVYYEET